LKLGRSITAVTQQIANDSENKFDRLIEQSSVTMVGDVEKLLQVPHVIFGHDHYKISPIAHAQLAEKLNIPKRYYDRLMECEYETGAPDGELLRQNVNYWLSARLPERTPRLFRFQKDDVNGDFIRAILSNSYHPIDNIEIIDTVLPIVIEQGAKVVSCEVTPSNLYIKLVTEDLKAEVKVGDIVRGGIMISNSEVGLGSVRLVPFVERLACQNGMVVKEGLNGNNLQYRRIHKGVSKHMSNYYAELISEETKTLRDQVVMSEISDVVRAIMSKETFIQIVDRMQMACETQIHDDAVEVLASQFQLLSKRDVKGIYAKLLSGLEDITMDGYQSSVYGLSQAVTSYSADVSDYDKATALEEIGWELLTKNAAPYKYEHGRTPLGQYA